MRKMQVHSQQKSGQNGLYFGWIFANEPVDSGQASVWRTGPEARTKKIRFGVVCRTSYFFDHFLCDASSRFWTHFRKESGSRLEELTPGAGPNSRERREGKAGTGEADTGGHRAGGQRTPAGGGPAPRGWPKKTAQAKPSRGGGDLGPAPGKSRDPPCGARRTKGPTASFAGGPFDRVTSPCEGTRHGAGRLSFTGPRLECDNAGRCPVL